MIDADRPLSPHVQVWRWHLTMFTSIAHRASGAGLYAGALILAAWAVALASGPAVYDSYRHLMGSPLGKVVLFLLTLGVFYHLANGIRHLVWDSGRGLDIKSANFSAVVAIAFAIVATLVIWGIAITTGAV